MIYMHVDTYKCVRVFVERMRKNNVETGIRTSMHTTKIAVKHDTISGKINGEIYLDYRQQK